MVLLVQDNDTDFRTAFTLLLLLTKQLTVAVSPCNTNSSRVVASANSPLQLRMIFCNSASFCCHHIPRYLIRWIFLYTSTKLSTEYSGCSKLYLLTILLIRRCISAPPSIRVQSVTTPSIISVVAVSPPVMIKFSMISPFLLGRPSPWLLCIDLASPPRSPELLPINGSYPPTSNRNGPFTLLLPKLNPFNRILLACQGCTPNLNCSGNLFLSAAATNASLANKPEAQW